MIRYRYINNGRTKLSIWSVFVSIKEIAITDGILLNNNHWSLIYPNLKIKWDTVYNGYISQIRKRKKKTRNALKKKEEKGYVRK